MFFTVWSVALRIINQNTFEDSIQLSIKIDFFFEYILILVFASSTKDDDDDDDDQIYQGVKDSIYTHTNTHTNTNTKRIADKYKKCSYKKIGLYLFFYNDDDRCRRSKVKIYTLFRMMMMMMIAE